MKKITEILETRYKTVREKDAIGNKTTKKVPYTAVREVDVLTGGKRFANAFVDGVALRVLLYFVKYAFIFISSFSQTPFSAAAVGFIGALLFLFLYPFYYVVFEYFFQRTPGKFLTKSLVIDIYGNKPDFRTSVLRSIIRLIPIEAFSFTSSKPRGWHDKWSDTFVVSEEEYSKIKELLLKENSNQPVV